MLKGPRQRRSGAASDSGQDPPLSDSELLVRAYSTRVVLPELAFAHRALRQRSTPDPATTTQLQRFQEYVLSRGSGHMTVTKFHVLQHIRRVRHELSFVVEKAHKADVSAWAAAANAILLLPDGNVREPQWHVLVSAGNGTSETGVDVPYPSEAWERKARSDALLAGQGLRVPSGLPPVVSEPEVELRPAPEVAARAMAVLMAAARAESAGQGAPLPLAKLRARFPQELVPLSAAEAAFIAQEHPLQPDIDKFGWRYEGAFLLEWALQLVPELPFPEKICDVPGTARVLLERDPRELLQQAHLRDPTEILDALDLHYRLNWCARDGRKMGGVPGLEAGVVQERHRALNWLVRFGGSDWDEVDTPT